MCPVSSTSFSSFATVLERMSSAWVVDWESRSAVIAFSNEGDGETFLKSLLDWVREGFVILLLFGPNVRGFWGWDFVVPEADLRGRPGGMAMGCGSNVAY